MKEWHQVGFSRHWLTKIQAYRGVDGTGMQRLRRRARAYRERGWKRIPREDMFLEKTEQSLARMLLHHAMIADAQMTVLMIFRWY